MSGFIVKKREGFWQVRIPLGRDAKGTRKFHTKTIEGNKKDAIAYKTKVIRELHTGTFVEPSKSLLMDYLRVWVTDYKPNLRESTRASYASLLESYVIPSLGSRKLRELQPVEIQRLWNSMIARGLSARTVRYSHAVLRGALQQAVKLGMLSRNPADLVELPAKQQREIRALKPEEVASFLEAARRDKWYPLWMLLITTGVRPGEALALKWSDVDLEGAWLSIRRVVSKKSGGELVYSEPKTQRSRRRIALPATMVSVLEAFKDVQKESGKRLEFVFPNEAGAPLDYKVLKRRHFKPVLKAAGLDGVRPYDLRHTCATLLLEAGIHPKIVSERLGHSSTVMTMDVYSHVLPHMQQESADRLEQMLFASTDNN